MFFLRIWGRGRIYVILIKKKWCTYSRCPCSKPSWGLECLYHELYGHPWHQRARQSWICKSGYPFLKQWQNFRTEPGCLYCTACRLVLLPLFNITKLFNDHILFFCLLYYGQSSFTFLLHEYRSFFLSDFLLYHYSDFRYYRSLLYYGKLKKKSGENKNKLRKIYPKNHENFKNSKSRVQFYWFL